MKILLVMAPALVGGLEQVVLGLATGLRQAGHDTRAFVVLDPGWAGRHPAEAGLRQAGVPVTTVEIPSRRYRAERQALSKLCAEFLPDILHTHGGRPDVVDARVARMHRIPWVSTVHGFTGGGGFKGRIYEWLQVRSLKRSDAVIAVSTPIVERLLRKGVPERHIHRVPNAWCPPSAGSVVERGAARDALGLPRGGVRLGWVGRVSHEKGPDVMVRALAALKRPHVQLSMVGDGGALASARMLATELGVDGQITWHGLVPNAGRLVAAFDVVVMSSRTEGTPIILFEAVAGRVPVVSTAVGGVPDVVSEGEAVLVPSENPQALAGGIARAIDDRGGALARATAAFERVAIRFSAGPWIERHVQVYDRLRGA